MDVVEINVEELLSSGNFTAVITYLRQKFEHESTPEKEKLECLAEVIVLYDDRNLYNEALELINALNLVAPNLRIPLLEFELLIRFNSNNLVVVNEIFDQLMEHKDEMVVFLWTLNIVGPILTRKESFDEYLVLYKKALKSALDDGPTVGEEQEYKDHLSHLRKKIEWGKKQLKKKKKKEEQEGKEKEAGGEVEKHEGAEVEKHEGAEVEEHEGGEVEEQEGDEVEKQEGAEVEKHEGGEVEKHEGAEVEEHEGAEVEKQEGAEVEKQEGAEAKSIKDILQEFADLDETKKSRETKKKGKSKWKQGKKLQVEKEVKRDEKEEEKEEEKKGDHLEGNGDGKEGNADDDITEEASKSVKDDLEGKKDVKKEEMKGKDDTIEEASKFDEFESPFTFRVQYLDDDECFLAFVKTDTTTVRKSIVKAQSIQIDNCQELVNICSRHECLVAVQHAVKLGGTDYLMTEEITSIKRFFGLKYQEYRPNTIQEWWLKIHDIFKILFRDIVRGLMFLFENQYSCGNVSFNIFVKDDGRGKILPSMKSSGKKEMREDLRQLIQAMKTVITFQFPQQEDLHSFLPHDLMSLFDFVKNADSEWNDVPILFLADHPYFWSISEKIEFTFKTRKFIKKSDHTTTMINLRLKNLHFFDNWKDKLTGVYLAVWKYSEKKKRPYRLNVDIVRYFGAVFTHVNERDYKKERKNKRIADEDIEEALLCFFPDYYISLFKGFCSCRQRGAISDEELMEVSGICHRST